MQALGRNAVGSLCRAHKGSLTLRSSWAATYATDADSHDDFKPKYKAPEGQDIQSTIQKAVSENKVFLFMKGVPQQPQCGFSNTACRILDAYGVQFGAANVLSDPALRDGIKAFTSWPTIPQIFVNGEFIGGADILFKMHESGDLLKLLEPIRLEQQKK